MAGSYDPVPNGVDAAFYEFATGTAKNDGISYTDQQTGVSVQGGTGNVVYPEGYFQGESKGGGAQGVADQAAANRARYAAGVAAKQARAAAAPPQMPRSRPMSPKVQTPMAPTQMPRQRPITPTMTKAAPLLSSWQTANWASLGLGLSRNPVLQPRQSNNPAQKHQTIGQTQYTTSRTAYHPYGTAIRTNTRSQQGVTALPPGARPAGLTGLFGQISAKQAQPQSSWQTANWAGMQRVVGTPIKQTTASYKSVLAPTPRNNPFGYGTATLGAPTPRNNPFGYQTQQAPNVRGKPNAIAAAQQTQTSGAYKIQKGDTLAGIAKKLGTTVAELKAQNNISNANQIYAGSTLKYSGNTAVSTLLSMNPVPLKDVPIPSGSDWTQHYAQIKGKANYFSSGKHGKGDIKNTVPATFTSKTSGKTFNLNVYGPAKDAMIGFLTELDSTGYDIQNIGSQVVRKKRGGSSMSEHSYGTAIDINGEIIDGETAARNQYGKNLVTDLPSNVSEMAAKYGLSWGGDWKSVKDAMHFEYTGSDPYQMTKEEDDSPFNSQAYADYLKKG